jgi:hypothetical protein
MGSADLTSSTGSPWEGGGVAVCLVRGFQVGTGLYGVFIVLRVITEFTCRLTSRRY